MICTLNFNNKLCCVGHFFKVNVNIKCIADFIRMKDIILNQFFYEDIEEVNDREKKHEIYYFLE